MGAARELSEAGSPSTRLREAVDGLDVGVVLVSGSGGVFLNRAAQELTGDDAEELADLDSWLGKLGGSESRRLRSLIDAADPGGTAPITVTLHRPDGGKLRIELVRHRFGDDEVWLIHDLTVSERARAEREELADLLAAIVATAVEAIVVIDEWGVITSFNPAAEAMFGYTAGEVVGEKVNILMPMPHRAHHDEYIRRYFDTGEARIIGTRRELDACHKDGHVFPIELSVAEIDHRRRFTGIMRDLSVQTDLRRRLMHAAEEEQRRVGGEIHDGLGGQLTGIAMLASTLRKRLAKSGSALVEDVDRIIEATGEAHQQLRGIARGLVPVEDVPEGLAVALQRLAQRCTDLTGVACSLDCAKKVPIRDPYVATQLFRIAQEAVNNALIHGQPENVVIGLRVGAEGIELSVRDDGVGLGEESDGSAGLGLKSMKSRARLCRGELTLAARPEGGTVVKCRVRV